MQLQEAGNDKAAHWASTYRAERRNPPALLLARLPSPVMLDCESSRLYSLTPRKLTEHDNRLPAIVTLATETSASAEYDNHAIATVNDHVVRISRMTQPYHRHSHPNSDETFLAVEGGLVIEFEHGEIQLAPGQMATGTGLVRLVRHRLISFSKPLMLKRK